MPLTRTEAAARASVVTPTHYAVTLDLSVSESEFESHTVLQFDATPGAETFVDLDPVTVHSMSLNGVELAASAFENRTIHLSDLQAHNELVVSSRMRFCHDGQGLHRAVDPADDQPYIFGHLFMDAAPRVFACFDQPDLKAPYTFTVTAPSEWTVLANAPLRRGKDGIWRGEQPRPLATYFVTVCAGPYASVTDEHAGVPLGIHARASLRPQLEAQAPHLLELTKTFLDYYNDLFGISYPFGEYHQVFVPEFNAGAMENPGCVTFRDQMIFTGVASDTEIMSRANTVAHEMAHMWFGDLVTMQWWDDLWLNESFAEYLANRTLVATGTFSQAWVDVAAERKAWGYAAERSPSTHPVAGAPADDTDTALQNFDGISYAKGSASLRQLIATVGDDAFIAGLRAHLTTHAFGNATLADFLGHVSDATDVDVRAWAKQWLETAGMDTLRVEADPSGHAELVVEPDARFKVTRPHQVQVAAFDKHGVLVATENVRDAQGRVRLPEIAKALEVHSDAVIVPNFGDLTWAGVAFDDEDVLAVAQSMVGIEDATTRAMMWTAFAHGLAIGTISPMTLIAAAEVAVPQETQMPILDVALGTLTGAVLRRFLPSSAREIARQRLAAIGEQLIEQGEDGSAQQLAGIRLVAQTGHAVRVCEWLTGEGLPSLLAADTNLRWSIAANLARQDALTVEQLDALLEADQTMSGQLGYLTARASLPGADHKEWAWAELTSEPTEQSPAHSNYEMNALASGFWSGADEVLAPYIARYVDDIPAMQAWVGQDALARVATLAFPRSLASESLDVEVQRMLSGQLTAAVYRAVVDQQALAREVLNSRATFGY